MAHRPKGAGFIMRHKHRIDFLAAAVIQPRNRAAQPCLSVTLFPGAASDCSTAVELPLQRHIPDVG